MPGEILFSVGGRKNGRRCNAHGVVHELICMAIIQRGLKVADLLMDGHCMRLMDIDNYEWMIESYEESHMVVKKGVSK